MFSGGAVVVYSFCGSANKAHKQDSDQSVLIMKIKTIRLREGEEIQVYRMNSGGQIPIAHPVWIKLYPDGNIRIRRRPKKISGKRKVCCNIVNGDDMKKERGKTI